MAEWILKYWAEWLFGIITAGLAIGYKSLSAKIKKRVIEDQAIKDGVLAMLHDRLYQSCRHYIAVGWVDLDGLDNIEYLYKSYHALGGNGTGSALYNRVKDLPYKEVKK